MAKRNLKTALGASMQEETDSTQTRVDKADTYFEAQEMPAAPTAQTKVVRDGFSMPADDYALIANLQAQCLKAGIAATKSALLRAGLRALREMSRDDLAELVGSLEKVKTGRPGKQL